MSEVADRDARRGRQWAVRLAPGEEMATLDIPAGASVVVLTGAGISAESGIPTFRDGGGLWERYDVRRVATPQGFEADPALVWQFYSDRRESALGCEPNAGHRALAALEERLAARGRLLLATQNVDGLHRRAGSRNVLEIHGSLFRTRCSVNGCDRGSAGWEDRASYRDGPPPCPSCGAALRPDIVWFGEYLDPRIEGAVRSAIEDCDLFLAVGTSGAVWPAAGYVRLASSHGARCILVNLDEPDNLDSFDEFHRGKAAELLPALLGTGD